MEQLAVTLVTLALHASLISWSLPDLGPPRSYCIPFVSPACCCALQRIKAEIVMWTAGFVLLTLIVNAPLLPWVLRVTGLSKGESLDLCRPSMVAKRARRAVTFLRCLIAAKRMLDSLQMS